MEKSGNMYVLNTKEYIRANKLNRPNMPLETIHVPGPCTVRVENIDVEPSIGLLVLSVQIGFDRGREYLVADSFESVVFKADAAGNNDLKAPSPPTFQPK